MLALNKIFDHLNKFRTPDLLRFFKCEHHLPKFELFFATYELGSLWDHLPAVIFFYLVFAFASAIGRLLASVLMREKLRHMDRKTRFKTRISWAHHSVAFVNAVITAYLAVQEVVRIWDRPLNVGTHNYYPEVARLLSVGVGYFIWDVLICLKHYSIYSPAFLLHGIMALIALVISFRPYMMNLVPYYMLVEISTIFLHTNWFIIKVIIFIIINLISLSFFTIFVDLVEKFYFILYK